MTDGGFAGPSGQENRGNRGVAFRALYFFNAALRMGRRTDRLNGTDTQLRPLTPTTRRPDTTFPFLESHEHGTDRRSLIQFFGGIGLADLRSRTLRGRGNWSPGPT